MRWTKTFIPTLREAPSDAESPSHKLMVRAGLIRQLAAGSYSYLPLGLRALRKAEQIVRDEMDRAGGVELLMPSLHPAELWQETGRFDVMGDTLMKLKDRKGALNVLGPTHEEVITHIVRNEVKSYRQLPITLYQIQGKFRDEARPRHGIIRTREFIMKDAYSFDQDEKGMGKSYQAMYDAYIRIYSRAELKFMPVEADTGVMGGDVSHEFMAVSPFGEDSVVTCEKCKYAANKEKAECPPAKAGSTMEDTREILPMQEIGTPGAHTIEQVSEFLKVPPRQLVKTLIFKTNTGFIAALVRGDHEVNEPKLRRAAQVETLEMATPEEIQRETGGPLGYSGVGGSSWKYEGWLGQIYTRSRYLSRGKFSQKLFEAECLQEYCETFPTVCGDFAFYQFPGESFWQKLFAQAPAGFQFAFKVPEQITCKRFPEHPRYGAQGGHRNPSFLDFFLLREAFLRPLEAYRDKIAVLIFEFGAFPKGSFSDVREFVELLDPFLTALPGDFRYAVEIRNEEFLGQEYFDCLRSHGVAHVFNAWARMPELKDQMAMPGSFTADFVVSRALLRRGRPYAQAVELFAPYTKIQDPNPEARAGLRELIERARDARRAAYIYVNNRLEGNSPGTIQAVIEQPS